MKTQFSCIKFNILLFWWTSETKLYETRNRTNPTYIPIMINNIFRLGRVGFREMNCSHYKWSTNLRPPSLITSKMSFLPLCLTFVMRENPSGHLPSSPPCQIIHNFEPLLLRLIIQRFFSYCDLTKRHIGMTFLYNLHTFVI